MNNCLAWEYTFCAFDGVNTRDARGVSSRPPRCTRCLGVLGGVARASLKRAVAGVEKIAGGMFSSWSSTWLVLVVISLSRMVRLALSLQGLTERDSCSTF